MRESPDPIRIEVASLVRKSVASLYSHLVTRPTGRAVRLAIESQLAEAGEPTISLVDFGEVTILDFSCADEVVARLLKRYAEADRPREAFFVFRGVQEWHREPIEAVLERQSLAAIVQREDGVGEILGALEGDERQVWDAVEDEGSMSAERSRERFSEPGARAALTRLVERRMVFSDPSGGVHALSRLVVGVGG